MPAPTPVDPWSVGLMALGGVAQQAMRPNMAQSGGNNAITYDNSGFVVSVGSSGATSSAKSGIPSVADALGATSGAIGGILSNPLLLILIGVGVYFYMKD